MILTEYAPKYVIPAIEQNNIDLFIFATKMGNKTLVIENDISWVIAKPFWPNYLFDPFFEIEYIGERLQFIGERIEKRILPPVIKFGPKGRPIDLAHHLAKNDFVDMLHNPAGMAINLGDLKDDLHRPISLDIRRVNTPELLNIWISKFTLFELEMFENLIEKQQIKLYVGMIEEKPVAVSMLFLSSGVAGIYQVQVDSDYRRRGIGAAITMAPLLDAKGMGYQIGVLQASKMGEPVYRRMGFEEFFRYEFYHRRDCTFRDFITA